MSSEEMERINVNLEQAIADTSNRLLPYFRFKHLPTKLQYTSAGFAELALRIVRNTDMRDMAEMTVALRKVLEGKDAAVRSCL